MTAWPRQAIVLLVRKYSISEHDLKAMNPQKVDPRMNLVGLRISRDMNVLAYLEDKIVLRWSRTPSLGMIRVSEPVHRTCSQQSS